MGTLNHWENEYYKLCRATEIVQRNFIIIDRELSKYFGTKSIAEYMSELDKIFIGNIGNNFSDKKKLEIIEQLNERCFSQDKSNKIIVDVETDGGRFGVSKVVQIAYYICNSSNDVIKKYNFYVYNRGVRGDYYGRVSEDILKKYGVSPRKIYEKLIRDMKSCNQIIGHNIKSFDIPRLTSYFRLFGLGFRVDIPVFDTMFNSRILVDVKGKHGQTKAPSLSDLAKFCGILYDPIGAHCALYDVDVTFNCYKILLISL